MVKINEIDVYIACAPPPQTLSPAGDNTIETIGWSTINYVVIQYHFYFWQGRFVSKDRPVSLQSEVETCSSKAKSGEEKVDMSPKGVRWQNTTSMVLDLSVE